MKKIFYPMMALAVAAFTFTACEDVPEPYTNPYDQHQVPDEAVLPDPAGTGTLADPYNVGGVLNYINELGADVTSPNDVYITGIVISIKEQFSAQYGNAQFDISDNANGGNKFTVYRALYLGNKKWVEGDKLLNEGDEVVICGKVVNYKGTTPETQQNAAYVYSINGEGGSGTPSGGDAIGTKDEPVNVARALADIDKLDEGATTKEFYYIKGKIKTIKTSAENIAKYKNIDYIITDDGNNELTVFRGKNLDNTDFTEAGQINVGDEVTVYGQLTKYKNPNTGAIVPEVAQGNYIVAKGSGGTTPPPAGDAKGTGTISDPYNVVKALQVCAEVGETGTTTDVYTKGIITAIKNVDTGTYGNAEFTISDDASASNKLTIYRALSLGNKKFTSTDEIKVGDEVIIVGKLVNFRGNTPEYTQGCYIYSLNGTTEGGNDTPTGETIGTKDAPVNVASALTDIDKLDEGATTEKFYYVKGKIKTIKTSAENIARYKNIDYTITDDGNNELTIFRGKNLDNTDFTAAGQINEGDEVVVYGQLTKYKNPNSGAIIPEMAQGNYIVSLKSDGGGETPDPNQGGGEVNGNSITVNATDFGFEDKGAATNYTLSDGTKITFDKGEGTTAPAYYGGNFASVRIYAKNTVTIVANKKITKVAITTTSPNSGTKYNGNDTAYAEGGSKVNINKESDTSVSFSGLNATTVTIVNDHSEAKGGTQLRISSMTITYAE